MRRSAWLTCCARSVRTCSRSTTPTAATAIRTTSRSTGSGRSLPRLAGTPVVLEATVPGRLFAGVLRVLALLGHPLGGSAPLGVGRVFSNPDLITHRVRVRGALRGKRAAMAAHGSQRRGGTGRRALDRFVRLPLPVFWLVFGREWYVEHGRRAPARLDDVFATLRRD